MSMAQWRNNTVRGKPENSEKYLSQCDSVHHESHTEQRDIDLGPPWCRAGDHRATNHLSHGTTVNRELARDLTRISLTTEFTDGLREQYDVRLWCQRAQLHKHIGLRITLPILLITTLQAVNGFRIVFSRVQLQRFYTHTICIPQMFGCESYIMTWVRSTAT
jgi:hypothetical protein